MGGLGCEMEATRQQEQLKRVARYLQEQLQPQALVTPLQVQCAIKDGLMVLVQHPPGDAPDPQQVFKVLETSIAALPADLSVLPVLNDSNLNDSKIKLYLRVLGQQKPYAFHHIGFAVSSPAGSPSQAAIADLKSPSELYPAEISVISKQSDLTEASTEEDSTKNVSALASPVKSRSVQAGSLARSQPGSLTPGLAGKRRSFVKPLLLASGGMAAVAILGLGGYALTRPCVVGGCAALETAQVLTQQSMQTLQTGNSPETDRQATQQLAQARQLVAEIPAWSSHAGQAQALRQSLDPVLAADATANSATQKGQATAQTVTDWQATQALWREAIAQLEAVPQESALAALAQKRLETYRANLTFIDQRIAAEQEGQKRLASARKTSELAIARQNTAQQLPDWQQAQATWQVAVNALKQIPNGTTSYTEAQQLLESYQPKLTETRNQATREQQANNAYTQATRLEKQAKGFQQANQWSQAIATWRTALNAAKQVPDGTSISSQAQILTTTYATSLKQAETVVKIRGDLDRVCVSSEKICTYTLKNEMIEVRFVPAYERKVRTLGGISSYSGDYEAMYKINRHFATLGNAFQTVSNNAGIPIQVYNSDNQLLGSFSPQG